MMEHHLFFPIPSKKAPLSLYHENENSFLQFTRKKNFLLLKGKKKN